MGSSEVAKKLPAWSGRGAITLRDSAGHRGATTSFFRNHCRNEVRATARLEALPETIEVVPSPALRTRLMG